MKQFLVEFTAEYYCQGYEWGVFQRLVTADSFDHACQLIKNKNTSDWLLGSPKYFKDLTL